MGRKSTVKQLDPRIRQAVDRLVREDKATIDQIVEKLEEMLGEAAPSRSAVGRYVKNTREQMKRYREAQELAKVWVGKLEEEPGGDVGRLLSEMLRTVAFQQLAGAGDEGAEVSTKEVAMLAGALRDLNAADKLSLERELKIRQEVAKQAADKAAEVAKRGGLSKSVVDDLRRELLGIAK
ncbi:MAG: DUF3486 family protein [Ectothiorhodospiraceae bacterium]|nr:DUF3486 family protein [Ectothiorhodospiraceae bacterium]